MTGAGGWVYAQALAAQSKTNELLSMSSIGSGGGSSDVSSENATEFWKNQTKLWNDAAKEWNGLLKKNDGQEDGKEAPKQSKK